MDWLDVTVWWREFWLAIELYPRGVVGWLLMFWGLNKLGRWYEKHREQRDREWERRENIRLDELYRRVWRPAQARRIAAEEGGDPAEIIAKFERYDRNRAAAHEEWLDDEAIERAAKERGCDAATLLAKIARRRDDDDDDD